MCVCFFFPFQGIKEVCHHSNNDKVAGGLNLLLKQSFQATGRKGLSLGAGPGDVSLVDLGPGQLGPCQLGPAMANLDIAMAKVGQVHHSTSHGQPGRGHGQAGL